MKTKDRRGKPTQRVALTFRSAELAQWNRAGNADLKVGATKPKERTGNVYENKGPPGKRRSADLQVSRDGKPKKWVPT
jgi:hypothetical protein